MGLKKGADVPTAENTVEQPAVEPVAEAPAAAEPEVVAPAPDPEPAPAPKPTPKPKAEGDAGRKMYVSKTGMITDPYARIRYNPDTPMPGGDESWLQCQLDAGVLLEYKQGEMGD